MRAVAGNSCGAIKKALRTIYRSKRSAVAVVKL